MQLRKARIADVPEMQRLINGFADKGDLLHRSLNQLYENVRDFHIFEDQGHVVATCALHVNWGDLAEIMALTVDESHQGKGLGLQIVQACIEDCKALGICRVFALTYKPEFFVKHGFRHIEKSELPQKVWTECINCVKFPDCGEVAVIRDLQ